MSPQFASERLEAPADPRAFHEWSLAEGFGDGLPLLPPTEDAVGALLAATPLPADHVLGLLAPAAVPATVEKAAVNAAMAGVAPAAFGYVVAALEAVLQPQFNWSALAATTSSVTPVLVVNGPRRAELGFDMEAGCMGGAAGRGSSTVGRAVQLCLRNIGGQRVGTTSKSVFGQLLNGMLGDGKPGSVREQRLDGSTLPEFELVRRYFGTTGMGMETRADGWYVVGAVLPPAQQDKEVARSPAQPVGR